MHDRHLIMNDNIPNGRCSRMEIVDVSVRDLFRHGKMEIGSNVTISAKVMGFDIEKGYLEIKLISMKERV